MNADPPNGDVSVGEEDVGVADKVVHSGSFRSSREIVPIDAVIISIQQNAKDEKREPPWLSYSAYLLSLAVFGIAGVATRYGFKLLSARRVAIGDRPVSLTSDESFLYPDLLSNMVGSFLMGWLGVVFKRDISNISDQLAVGLSTGFLGCLTTFSGWNQSVLDLTVAGRWLYALLCVIIGFLLAGLSIVLGVWTAEVSKRSKLAAAIRFPSCQLNITRRLILLFTVLFASLTLLWALFACLLAEHIKHGGGAAELFLGGLVGPFGVWLRWHLSRLNARGFGKNSTLKWLPFGTLAANVLAACIMAALATLKEADNDRDLDTAATGIQLGFLGSLSTVSTFMSELYEMGRSRHPFRGVCYAAITVALSFGLGTLIYSVPVWVKNYS